MIRIHENKELILPKGGVCVCGSKDSVRKFAKSGEKVQIIQVQEYLFENTIEKPSWSLSKL